MSGITRLQVATVYVTDVDAAVEFWTEALGFIQVADWSGEDGERMAFVRPRDAVTEIGLYGVDQGDARVGGSTGLVFTSDDIRASVRVMRGRGVRLISDIVVHEYGEGDFEEDAGDLEATFADPDGNTFLLHS